MHWVLTCHTQFDAEDGQYDSWLHQRGWPRYLKLERDPQKQPKWHQRTLWPTYSIAETATGIISQTNSRRRGYRGAMWVWSVWVEWDPQLGSLWPGETIMDKVTWAEGSSVAVLKSKPPTCKSLACIWSPWLSSDFILYFKDLVMIEEICFPSIIWLKKKQGAGLITKSQHKVPALTKDARPLRADGRGRVCFL